jgi:hypothetical protein
MTATKKLIAAVASMLALLASAQTSTAETAGTENEALVFDSCMAHDWMRFVEAVEANDYLTLDAMARDPQLLACPEIVATAEVLACAGDPMLCIEPAAGPNVPEVEQDAPPPTLPCAANCGPFPGQRPGQQLGIERDTGGDDSGNTDTPSAGASPSAGPGAGSTPGV